MRRLFALGFGVFLLTGWAAACAGDDELGASQHARWDDAKPKTYVVQTCTKGIEPPGCYRAAVDRDHVVSAEGRVYAEDLGWERVDDPFEPIDYMFEQLRQPKDDCVLQDASYDKSLSFVRSYTLSCGDEDDVKVKGGQYVACFVPDSLEVKDCDAIPSM